MTPSKLGSRLFIIILTIFTIPGCNLFFGLGEPEWLGQRVATSNTNNDVETHLALGAALQNLCRETRNKAACAQGVFCSSFDACPAGSDPIVILTNTTDDDVPNNSLPGFITPGGTYCSTEHAHYYVMLLRPESTNEGGSTLWNIRGYLKCILCKHEIKLGLYTLNASNAEAARTQANSILQLIIDFFKSKSLSWPAKPTFN